MLLNRNNNCSRSCNWLIYLVVIVVIAVAAYGGRDQIKDLMGGFSSVDKGAVEKIVQEYIENNPKAIVSSLQKMQEREYEEMMKQSQMKLKDNADELQGKGHEIAPFAGNKNGKSTVIAFLDYRCGYCKTSNKTLQELIKQDSNVKVIFKELPVLGPQSQKISQMALAVYLIDEQKYIAFHDAAMNAPSLDDKALAGILKTLNIDVSKVSALMKDERIAKELASVSNLAQQLGVRGTPAFVINETLIPGAIDLKGMKEIINKSSTK